MDQGEDWSCRPAAIATAEPAERRSPRAHPSSCPISPPSCVTGSWCEIATLLSEDSATAWAQRALAAKNQLTAADARLLEVAFELRLSALLPSERSGSSVGSGSRGPSSFAGDDTMGTSPGPDDVGNDQPTGVDKSTLAVPAPRRYRDKAHLRYVAHQHCLLCARKPSDPHHLRHLQPRPATEASKTVALDNVAPTIAIDTTLAGDNIVNAAEDNTFVVSGTTSGVEDGQTVTVHLTDGSTTVTTTATVAGGVWTATAADISGLTNGNLTIHRDGADHCNGFTSAGGVEFIDENGGGPGVRLRKSGKEKPRK